MKYPIEIRSKSTRQGLRLLCCKIGEQSEWAVIDLQLYICYWAGGWWRAVRTAVRRPANINKRPLHQTANMSATEWTMVFIRRL